MFTVTVASLGSYLGYSAYDAYQRYSRLTNNRPGDTRRFGREGVIEKATCTSGCNIYSFGKEYELPPFVSTGGNHLAMAFPAGNMEEKEVEKRVYSTFKLKNIQKPHELDESHSVINECNFRNYEFDFENTTNLPYETGYINSYSDFLGYCRMLSIPKDKVKMTLPLKVNKLTGDRKPTVFVSRDTFQIQMNKQKLIKTIVAKRRMPLTFTCAALLGIVWSCREERLSC